MRGELPQKDVVDDVPVRCVCGSAEVVSTRGQGDFADPCVTFTGSALDEPAWYATKAATLAQVHNIPGPVGMQLEYSLVERGLERERLPAALECGLGVTPWSPLAGGFLTGKYARKDEGASGEGRLSKSNPFQGPFTKFTERNWGILDTPKEVSGEQSRPPAQVALAWAAAQPGVSSILTGASRLEQLQDNLASLTVELTPEQLQKLNESSRPEGVFFTDDLKRLILGSHEVKSWR